jgi:MFS family permease
VGGNRVPIVSLTAALWSAAVALSAVAAKFVQFVFIRIGVTVGEAGCHPPAFSLIGDYYSQPERSRAIAVQSSSISLHRAADIGYFGGSSRPKQYQADPRIGMT